MDMCIICNIQIHTSSGNIRTLKVFQVPYSKNLRGREFSWISQIFISPQKFHLCHRYPQMFYDEITICHRAAKVSCYMVLRSSSVPFKNQKALGLSTITTYTA